MKLTVDKEDAQHNLLLVVSALLFYLFTTGKAVPPEITSDVTIIPS